jgi:hypothetical protein
MSDTPETDLAEVIHSRFSEVFRTMANERDEAVEELYDIRLNLGEDAEGYTLTHAVCVLQNERDEAREALKHIEEYGTDEINAAVELRQKLAQTLIERDEARRKLNNLDVTAIHSCHNECQRPICVLRRERDEAREALNKILKNE